MEFQPRSMIPNPTSSVSLSDDPLPSYEDLEEGPPPAYSSVVDQPTSSQIEAEDDPPPQYSSVETETPTQVKETEV